MTDKPENVLEHEYDGIRECDNQLPKWWINIFYATIIFSIGYFVYYHVAKVGPSSTAEIDEALAAAKKEAPAAAPLLLEEATFQPFLKDSNSLAMGLAVYNGKCLPCHGPGGGGLVGPNLADKFWIHGGKIAQIAASIADGVPDKGMPSWRPVLSDKELIGVVSYVVSLKGTTPPNPKAAQGNPEE